MKKYLTAFIFTVIVRVLPLFGAMQFFSAAAETGGDKCKICTSWKFAFNIVFLHYRVNYRVNNMRFLSQKDVDSAMSRNIFNMLHKKERNFCS
ncbi:hypothetical protein ACS25B_11510 [Dickeya dadantii subsp. dieffenbachiae]|uniref:hypothetical protein n=1 Tax=Dickeya dadantii TaxID=204038 RepID=UPI003F23515E